MTPRNSTWSHALAALALAGLLAFPATRARAGVDVALQGPAGAVAPGSEFDVTLELPLAGSPINRFTAIVDFDPSALTLVPLVPISQQEGCLLTGLCSGACGTTGFHLFTPGADSVAFADGMLCGGGAVTGPGTLYRLHFRAANAPQVTTVVLRQANFWNAGLIVSPVTTADATIGIGVALGVGEPPTVARLAVRALPNPARGRAAFAIDSDRAGERVLEVHDVAGRLVRRLAGARRDAGPERVAWDGSDRLGARVGPGLYLVTLRVAGRSATTRLALVD